MSLGYIEERKSPWHGAHGRPHDNIGSGEDLAWNVLNMESMTPHDTFSFESFILNFQILAPKCSAFCPIS